MNKKTHRLKIMPDLLKIRHPVLKKHPARLTFEQKESPPPGAEGLIPAIDYALVLAITSDSCASLLCLLPYPKYKNKPITSQPTSRAQLVQPRP